MKRLRGVWDPLKLELPVALKTLGVAWASLTAGLLLFALVTEPRGVREAVGVLSLGIVICAASTFWPAVAVATCRSVYRLLGVGVFIGAFWIVVGVLGALVGFRNVLFSMFLAVFEQVQFSEPCGAHAPGPAPFCLAAALLGSPGSGWALLELFLSLSGITLLGSVPGVLLWLVLVARQWAKLASSAISR